MKPDGKRLIRSKISANIEDEIRAKALGGMSYDKIVIWLKEAHGLDLSKAGISRAAHNSGVRAGQVLYKTETKVTIVERESGPEVDDDAVCALYRNELLKEMQAAKKERQEGGISAQEWRSTLIQLARASNDVVKTRKLLRAPDKAPQGFAPGQQEPQGAEVVFGGVGAQA